MARRMPTRSPGVRTVDPTKIGLIRVCRSDWGHTEMLQKALLCQVIRGETFRTFGHAANHFNRLLRGKRPQAVIIPTDRWEMMAAAVSALMLNIPIIQLHAGEETPYAFDDEFRRSITQMAQLLFCSHEAHAQELSRQGIPRDRIHVTGAPGLDRLLLPRDDRETIAKALSLNPY